MNFQPNDVFVTRWIYDENKFKSLPDMLAFADDFQIPTDKSNMDPEEYLSSKSNELVAANFDNKFICETVDSFATPTLAPCYPIGEQLSSEYPFDESHLLDPFESPNNEVIVTTSASENNDTPLQFPLARYQNLTPDQIATILQQDCNQIALQNIDSSIQQRTMSIDNQPPVNLRARYRSDGTRQIEKSRTKPMAVKLPNLKDIKLDPGQSFLLRLALIKCNKNSSDQPCLHVNKLEYHSDDVQELNDGTICVLLTPDDIGKGKKILPRLSIVKTKLAAYKSKLIPYNLFGNNNALLENTDKNEKISVKEAKKIFKNFNMKASRIGCQLLIKQNESIHFTNIICQTHVIKEKNSKSTTTKKR